jgi:hypothetical protein
MKKTYVRKQTVLTQAKIKELMDYDPDTGDLTWIKPRPKIRVGEVAGSKKVNGYIGIMVLGRLYLAHRLIWLHVHGAWPKHQLDHINHDRTDNRLTNLREATQKENCKNMSIRSDNKSGVIGVFWYERYKKWEVYIKNNGKKVYLCRITDFFEAVCIRKSAENKYGYHENHGSTK